MKINLLGPGCANCKRVEQTARRKVGKLGLAADIEKVTDYGQIMAYGVMSTPGAAGQQIPGHQLLQDLPLRGRRFDDRRPGTGLHGSNSKYDLNQAQVQVGQT